MCLCKPVHIICIHVRVHVHTCCMCNLIPRLSLLVRVHRSCVPLLRVRRESWVRGYCMCIYILYMIRWFHNKTCTAVLDLVVSCTCITTPHVRMAESDLVECSCVIVYATLPPLPPSYIQNIKFFSVPPHTPVILAESGDCATTLVRMLCKDAKGTVETRQLNNYCPLWVMDIVCQVLCTCIYSIYMHVHVKSRMKRRWRERD